jgi:hypothetical protein
MGQRTQLLVRTHFGDEETETMVTRHSAYHYQWGYGRVMPMFALHIVSEFESFLPDSRDDMNEAIDELLLKMKKIASPKYDEDLFEDYFVDVENRESKLNNIFNNPTYQYFDNNNGFMTLDLYFKKMPYNRYEIVISKLSVYELDGKQITIGRWCANYREFISNEWQTGYIKLMKSYGVEFAKPFEA